MGSNKIICFGEILWDIFPEKRKLGGAPFNVASSLKGLGADVEFFSRIGNDSLGVQIKSELTNQGISSDYLQIDQEHPTGKVLVSLNEKTIVEIRIINFIILL